MRRAASKISCSWGMASIVAQLTLPRDEPALQCEMRAARARKKIFGRCVRSPRGGSSLRRAAVAVAVAVVVLVAVVVVVAHLQSQPAARVGPVAVGGGRGDAQRGGRLVVGQSGEKAEV